MTKIQWKILIFPIVIIGVVIFNYGILERIIIPDACYYHSHDTNFIFDIFYNTSSASGGHPEPNLFNFLFTLMTGFFIAKYILKKIN